MYNNSKDIEAEDQRVSAVPSQGDQAVAEVEIDVSEFTERGEGAPHVRRTTIRNGSCR